MKNTDFPVSLMPPEMKALIESWKSEGFEVVVAETNKGRDKAVQFILNKIKWKRLDVECLETATAFYGFTSYVAVKCRIKE